MIDEKVHFQYTFVAKPGTAETAEHCSCNRRNFQVGKRFSDSIVCTDYGVLPKSSKLELHMQFLDPDVGYSQVAAGAQFHHRILLSFSVKGSEAGM
ncbi:hypothetical protein U1Q18_006234 [Sarracenia purpurea var. burkii]